MEEDFDAIVSIAEKISSNNIGEELTEVQKDENKLNDEKCQPYNLTVALSIVNSSEEALEKWLAG